MNELTITIRFGNAAMQTVEDAAEALERVAEKLRNGSEPGYVMDLNGNKVGEITYEEE